MPAVLLALLLASPDLPTLAARYGLEVVTAGEPFPIETRWGELTGRDASAEDLARYLPLFLAEWSFYPPELVAAIGLERVVLCEGLAFAGQHRAAVPLFGTNTYYLDVRLGREHRWYQERCLHHDLYHIIDWRDDGLLGEDAAWRALTRRRFAYGDGGASRYGGQGDQNASPREIGFLSVYSTSGLEEDKAELFGYLMVRPHRVTAEAGGDTVLHAKLRRLQAELQAFCPALDQAFWARVRAARADAARRERTLRWLARRPRPRPSR